MKVAIRFILALAFFTGFAFTVAAQELPAGTKVLAQTSTDVKFYPATIVKKSLDGYTVQFEDGSVQDVLQADMAFEQALDPAELKPDVKVAVFLYGEFYPGRIYEIGEDGNCTVAWESGGTDPATSENLHARMAPRTDPRPTPAVEAPVVASPAATAPKVSGSAAQPTPAAPAKPAPAAVSPAAPPPAAANNDDNPLAAILGMAGDRYLMTYSQVLPVKSATLTAKTELADITLDIPQDYIPVGLDFKVKNKSGKALTIDWSKCYVSSFAGVKRSIYHLDYQALEDLPATEKPSDVSAGAEQSFSLRPRDGLVTTFHPAEYDANGVLQPKWNEILNTMLFFGPDLPNALTFGTSQADKDKDLGLRRKNVVGKSFKVGIALISGGKPSVVEFTVRIEDLKFTHEANMLDSIGK